ncbi:MAG: ABC transporter permease [Clostridia bacterium]|nr:ABC transporter permease [Clostridia bacterium]MBQ3006155.1 ABC transporter permease [Clostridia bacterium]
MKYFKNFYKYRYLLFEIVRKNIKLQYRNSVLGIFWTFLQPLMTTLVLVLIFGGVFGRKDASLVNYPIYLLCGRLIYEFFTQSTKRAMRSISNSASVIKKVYVPKYIYPLSNVIANFVTFIISLLVLVCFIVYFYFFSAEPPHITPYVFLSPVPIIILLILSVGIGLILCTLQVFFKDIEYLYEVFCMLLFYMTPIIYTLDTLNIQLEWVKIILMANPLYSIIEMFRDCVLFGEMMNPNHVLYSLGFSLATLFIGLLAFYKKQDKFILHI